MLNLVSAIHQTATPGERENNPHLKNQRDGTHEAANHLRHTRACISAFHEGQAGHDKGAGTNQQYQNSGNNRVEPHRHELHEPKDRGRNNAAQAKHDGRPFI